MPTTGRVPDRPFMDVPIQRSAVGCQLVTDVARSFGEVRVKVTGASMIPAVWPGDVITVRSTSLVDLQPGQIVLHRREEKLIAHRVTRIHDNLLITQGDSIPYEDPPVNEADMVGLVVGLLRNGHLMDLKQSEWQRISALILRRLRCLAHGRSRLPPPDRGSLRALVGVRGAVRSRVTRETSEGAQCRSRTSSVGSSR